MRIRSAPLLAALFIVIAGFGASPNILVILAYDLGWADLACRNPRT